MFDVRAGGFNLSNGDWFAVGDPEFVVSLLLL